MKRFNHTPRHVTLVILMLLVWKVNAQQADSTKNEQFSIHAQTTVINQYKPSFSAKYSGLNSLSDQAEDQTSVTSTIFAGARLWTGASIFMNPELGGGSGLSGALGVAASTNGETYRIGNPKPRISLARIFYRQLFDLDDKEEYQESDQNQLAGMTPKNYFGIIIGKISLSDYFDDNKYSHDPRTQFMSWGLMNNGAWDYAANTIGYTPSILLEWVKDNEELRYDFSLVSEIANGMQMNWQINKANSNNLEYTHHYHIGKQQGAIRFLGYLNIAPMGNYEQAIKLSLSTDPPIGFNGANNALNVNGHTKYGFCLNIEQDINENLGCFFRAGWNDGHNESWEFTEIDRTASVGISSTGSKWKRKDDNVGLAYVVSGLSAPHREYLKDGGMGFILGDGNLNYGLENLVEAYYSFALSKHLFLSGAYQFILNPGYNMDRGPVNVFSVRLHTSI